MTDQLDALTRVVALINWKGGVGKTTIAANIAGMLAQSGTRILVVDLDPQGHIGRDLGYRWTSQDDYGESLSMALHYGKPAKPLVGVRDNLDVLRGGPWLDGTAAALSPGASNIDATQALVKILVPMAADYDLIIVDCPPGHPALQTAALTAARWAIVPVKADAGSSDGIETLDRRLKAARPAGSRCELLGVVIFDVSSAATRVRKTARDQVTALTGDEKMLFDAVVRHSETYAQDGRQYGKLAHELEEVASKQKNRWIRLRRGEAVDEPQVSQTAAGVADDLHALAGEIIDRVTAAEQKQATP